MDTTKLVRVRNLKEGVVLWRDSTRLLVLEIATPRVPCLGARSDLDERWRLGVVAVDDAGTRISARQDLAMDGDENVRVAV